LYHLSFELYLLGADVYKKQKEGLVDFQELTELLATARAELNIILYYPPALRAKSIDGLLRVSWRGLLRICLIWVTLLCNNFWSCKIVENGCRPAENY
jgi:hypothetical protein